MVFSNSDRNFRYLFRSNVEITAIWNTWSTDGALIWICYWKIDSQYAFERKPWSINNTEGCLRDFVHQNETGLVNLHSELFDSARLGARKIHGHRKFSEKTIQKTCVLIVVIDERNIVCESLKVLDIENLKDERSQWDLFEIAKTNCFLVSKMVNFGVYRYVNIHVLCISLG